MAESKYESKICAIQAPIAQVYAVLSNFKNFERVKEFMPKDKIQEIDIEEDIVRIKVDGLGQKIDIRIIDRIYNDTIKFGLDNLPGIAANFWIQLKEAAPADTRIKLTLKADIPMMFKLMLDKKIQEGLDQAAMMLTQFPYTQWANI